MPKDRCQGYRGDRLALVACLCRYVYPWAHLSFTLDKTLLTTNHRFGCLIIHILPLISLQSPFPCWGCHTPARRELSFGVYSFPASYIYSGYCTDPSRSPYTNSMHPQASHSSTCYFFMNLTSIRSYDIEVSAIPPATLLASDLDSRYQLLGG